MAVCAILPGCLGTFVASYVDICTWEEFYDFIQHSLQKGKSFFFGAIHLIEYSPRTRHVISRIGRARKLRIRGYGSDGMARHFDFRDDRNVFAGCISHYLFYLFLSIISSDFFPVKDLRIVGIIVIYQSFFSFRTDFHQFGELFNFNSPSLIIRQVPVENVHLVHGKHVDKLVYIIYRSEIPAWIEHHSTVRETGSIFYFDGWYRPVGAFVTYFTVNLRGEKLIKCLQSIEKTVGL